MPLPILLLLGLGGVAVAAAASRPSGVASDYSAESVSGADVPFRAISPYRLEDVRALGAWVGRQCAWSDPAARKRDADEFKSVGPEWVPVAAELSVIAQRAINYQNCQWSSELDEIQAWVWNVILPAQLWLFGVRFIRLNEQRPDRLFASSLSLCSSTQNIPGVMRYAGTFPNQPAGTIYYNPSTKYEASKIPGCTKFHAAETLQALATWTAGFLISPGVVYSYLDGRAPMYLDPSFAQWGNASEKALGTVVGKGKNADGYDVWRIGRIFPADASKSLGLIARIGALGNAKRNLWGSRDKGEGSGSLYDLAARMQGSTNPLESAQLLADFLVRSQFYGEAVWSERYLDNDPGKIYFKVFGAMADAWSAAASVVGTKVLAKLGDLGGTLSNKLGDMAGLSKGLTSALNLAVRSAIAAGVQAALDESPLKFTLGSDAPPLDAALDQLKNAGRLELAAKTSGKSEQALSLGKFAGQKAGLIK